MAGIWNLEFLCKKNKHISNVKRAVTSISSLGRNLLNSWKVTETGARLRKLKRRRSEVKIRWSTSLTPNPNGSMEKAPTHLSSVSLPHTTSYFCGLPCLCIGSFPIAMNYYMPRYDKWMVLFLVLMTLLSIY